LKTVFIDGETLTIKDVVSVAREDAKVGISQRVKAKVKQSREFLEQLVKQKKTVYGVTTGFSAFGNVAISPKSLKELQSNLIRSHSAGVGKPADKEVVRAMMLLRLNTLAKGYSGVRLEILETLVQMLNQGVHPIVPEKGSVGASGDLAPLSHMGLVMMGEGEAEYRGKTMSGKEALKKAGIKPVELDVKEGVALNNGPQFTTAMAVLAVHDAEKLITTAEAATALSLEALNGISDAFDERIHKARPHAGQIATARNIRSLTADSKIIMPSEKATTLRMHPQDTYSLRCVPQVLGTVRDVIAYAKNVIQVEINSATDNPLIFAEDNTCLSGGNFHAQPISAAMDFLAVGLTTLGNMSERRIARLIDENLSRGLPAFLIHRGTRKGIESGFMAMQITAAALASENKALAHPASVDSIPTSANFEDFVSMGPTAARKAIEILRNAEQIVAIELLCAAQGVEFRGAEKMGKGTQTVHSLIRSRVPTLKEDRPLFKDVKEVVALIQNGEIPNAVKPFVKVFL